MIAIALAAFCVSGCFSLSGPTPNRPRYDYSQPVPQPESNESKNRQPASASQPRSGSTAPAQVPANSTAH